MISRQLLLAVQIKMKITIPAAVKAAPPRINPRKILPINLASAMVSAKIMEIVHVTVIVSVMVIVTVVGI